MPATEEAAQAQTEPPPDEPPTRPHLTRIK
jgi:hypothetical protein